MEAQGVTRMALSLSEKTLAPRVPPSSQFAAAAILVAAVTWNFSATAPAPDFPAPQTVSLLPNPVSYRVSGEFLLNGMPVDGQLQKVRIQTPLKVMTYQVSEQQYARCVNDRDCETLDHPIDPNGNRPVTGVSFLDAEKYGAWLSRRTGDSWRLPTDQEWASLSGSKYADDALAPNSGAGPAQRWISQYEAESSKAGRPDPEIHASGFFGSNEYGLADLSGNVWEWTSACYTRTALSNDGSVSSAIENCGVRVAEGAHRAYVTAFIRDAKGGGCSAGAPPDHLGMRLVREEPRFFSWQWLSSFLPG
jgi:formylglycine-generating enzyme required for sulfatase activity